MLPSNATRKQIRARLDALAYSLLRIWDDDARREIIELHQRLKNLEDKERG